MHADDPAIWLEVRGMQHFERSGHLAVQQCAPRRQDLLVGDLPDAVVGKVEALANAVHYPAAHQLL